MAAAPTKTAVLAMLTMPTMIEVLPFALLACACGAAAVGVTASPTPGSSNGGARASAAGATAPRAAASAGPTAEHDLEALLAAGPALAPGMETVAQRTAGAEPVDLVHADAGDACVRAAFRASAPVVARLLDGHGGTLAITGAATVEGALGERGPVCVRRGDVVRAAVEGEAGGAGAADGAGLRVTWVAWRAR